MKSLLAMPHLAARLFGTPLAIEPGKLSIILGAIGERVTGYELEGLLPAKSAAKQERAESITTIVDGVACLDVTGTLVHRSSWMDAMSGLASYENLSAEFDKAATDPNVKAILLCLNSPGGEVSGMFEMAERIHSARKPGRPIYAIAADTACSAAYMLGAACDKFFATEAACTGSIGVVVAHMDVSEADKKAGVKITHVHAGARKVDGNPHEPLSPEGKDTLQALVDSTAAVFFGRVAAYRGVSVDAIRATEAAVYVGADAVKAGIIDGIRSTRAVLAELKSGQRSMAFSQQVAQAMSASGGGTYAISGGSGGGGGSISVTVIGTLDAASRKDLAQQLRAEMEEAPAGPAPEKCPDCGESEEDCTCEETDASGSAVAPANQPPQSGEAHMDLKQMEAALAAVTKERDDLKIALAKHEARVAALTLSQREAVIDKHIRAGVAPAMRGAAEKLAASLSPEDLDSEMATWPRLSRPVATGKTDAAPSADELPNADPLAALNAKAKEIQAATPGITFADAFSKACFANPSLYTAHRAATTLRAKKGA